MPLHKGSSVSLPSEIVAKDQHPLKRKQPLSFDERSGPAATDAKPMKNQLIRSNDLLIQTPIEVLLDLLKQFAGVKDISDETQVHLFMVIFFCDVTNNLNLKFPLQILSELYLRVKATKGGTKGAILGALYGLVECQSSKILLAVARVVLGLGVTGSNLTGACKLVFKVARNEINDLLFIDSDVPELLVEGDLIHFECSLTTFFEILFSAGKSNTDN
jgi:armadillo repeat-containing protein 2